MTPTIFNNNISGFDRAYPEFMIDPVSGSDNPSDPLGGEPFKTLTGVREFAHRYFNHLTYASCRVTNTSTFTVEAYLEPPNNARTFNFTKNGVVTIDFEPLDWQYPYCDVYQAMSTNIQMRNPVYAVSPVRSSLHSYYSPHTTMTRDCEGVVYMDAMSYLLMYNNWNVTLETGAMADPVAPVIVTDPGSVIALRNRLMITNADGPVTCEIFGHIYAWLGQTGEINLPVGSTINVYPSGSISPNVTITGATVVPQTTVSQELVQYMRRKRDRVHARLSNKHGTEYYKDQRAAQQLLQHAKETVGV